MIFAAVSHAISRTVGRQRCGFVDGMTMVVMLRIEMEKQIEIDVLQGSLESWTRLNDLLVTEKGGETQTYCWYLHIRSTERLK